jgi:hypothetical protein
MEVQISEWASHSSVASPGEKMKMRRACLVLLLVAGGTNLTYAQGKKSACQSPEYRQFDFWLGDWDVHSPDGPSVGRNLVTSEQDGCLLIEHWTSSTGEETGTSFNYYDVRDKKWHQLYLDNSGNAGDFPAMGGNLIDGKMVLVSDEKQSPVFRWTWYVLSPGKVRQMAEKSDDGQKTWKIVWDSVYVKAGTSTPAKK